MNKYRTHNCNELSKDDIGKNVKISVGFTEKEIMETYCSLISEITLVLRSVS